ncbi:carboxymuconolactone decarboxylase family protein [Paraliomyxa miuraensis]|uniref:hypothetical protein n=1 Tax=Paraliomyxa miuraensis TaxID=376150 RepID=UPI002259CF53|nr:hypothetical protein [Paraliomyxa miuraensis]MCX4241326.1 hypothetical protein [Paraliomyxa miuraensis]
MSFDFDTILEKMLASLFESDDPLAPLRRNAAKRTAARLGVGLEGTELDPGLQAYVDKVGKEPFKVVDEDIEELRKAGLSTTEIFDVTVGAAVGASLARLELGRKVMAGGAP